MWLEGEDERRTEQERWRKKSIRLLCNLAAERGESPGMWLFLTNVRQNNKLCWKIMWQPHGVASLCWNTVHRPCVKTCCSAPKMLWQVYSNVLSHLSAFSWLLLSALDASVFFPLAISSYILWKLSVTTNHLKVRPHTNPRRGNMSSSSTDRNAGVRRAAANTVKTVTHSAVIHVKVMGQWPVCVCVFCSERGKG